VVKGTERAEQLAVVLTEAVWQMRGSKWRGDCSGWSSAASVGGGVREGSFLPPPGFGPCPATSPPKSRKSMNKFGLKITHYYYYSSPTRFVVTVARQPRAVQSISASQSL